MINPSKEKHKPLKGSILKEDLIMKIAVVAANGKAGQLIVKEAGP